MQEHIVQDPTAKQATVAKEILGLRSSTENAGALLELGWTDVETKAAKARLLFWWRLGRTQSELMRQLQVQAHMPGLREQTEERRSQCN